MQFALWSALGNRFVVIPVTTDPHAPVLPGVEEVCDAEYGIGADGVAFVNIRRKYLHIYNADGGRAEISGNGARCAAAWWFGRRRNTASRVHWRTDAGDVLCSRRSKTVVSVELPPPSLAAADIPALADTPELWGARLAFPPGGLPPVTVYGLSVGNPQVVIWGARIPANWREIGRALEEHHIFPERTNVVFARITRAGVAVRIWERGAGETASSGTGASAAAIVGARRGLTGRSTSVEMPGGSMLVSWLKSDRIRTSCAVTEIASGSLAKEIELGS